MVMNEQPMLGLMAWHIVHVTFKHYFQYLSEVCVCLQYVVYHGVTVDLHIDDDCDCEAAKAYSVSAGLSL